MEFISRAQARQDIVDLRLPQIVLDVFDEKPLPYDLDINFYYPYQMFTPGQSYDRLGRITPLWHCCDVIVAYRHTTSCRGFYRFDIESPEEDFEPAGLTWQGILVHEFNFLWEDEWPDERLKEVAGWFEFKHIDLLISERQQGTGDFEKHGDWERAFLKKIGGFMDQDQQSR
jgi:hypothetical protein